MKSLLFSTRNFLASVFTVCLVIMGFLNPNQAYGQTTIGTSPYTVPSSGNYTVPAGVTSMTIYAFGAGGGGGNGTTACSAQGDGGGGGGGGSVQATLTVSGGQIYAISIPATTAAATIGGNATISGNGYSITAVGGGKGITSTCTGSTAAGAGGSGSTATGTGISGVVAYAGGSGSVGADANSGVVGSGGGGAGSGSVGGNASGCTAGTAGTGTYPGGAGGKTAGCGSGTTSSVGVTGTAPGGGGSGGECYSTAENGGTGGAGKVIIVWTYPPCSVPTAAATGLTFTSVTSTAISGSYTAASPAPTGGYLVIQSTSSTLSPNPVNSTTYAVGNSVGGGTVCAVNAPGTLTFTTTGSLTTGTLYYFYIIPFNYTAGTCSQNYGTSLILTGQQYTQTLLTNPASPWVVPANVTSITVYAFGAGGGGGNGTTACSNQGDGSGGGGGASVQATLAVTAGQSYTLSVPATTAAATTGGNATFSGNGYSITAVGGGKGITSTCTGSTTAGAGGSGSTATGTGISGVVTYNGGNGSAGADANSGVVGSGGGGAGSGSVGGNASGCTAGTAGTGTYPGGAGGKTAGCGSGTTSSVGVTGTAPGGGGSGGECYSTAENGGTGGAGKIIITYTLVSCAAPTSVTAALTGGTSECSTAINGTIAATPTGGNTGGGSWQYLWTIDGVAGTWGATSSQTLSALSLGVGSHTFIVAMRSTSCSGSVSPNSNTVTVAVVAPATPGNIAVSAAGYTATTINTTNDYINVCPGTSVTITGSGGTGTALFYIGDNTNALTEWAYLSGVAEAGAFNQTFNKPGYYLIETYGYNSTCGNSTTGGFTSAGYTYAQVEVAPVQAPVVTPSQTICSGGTPTTLSGSAGSLGIGTLAYQWQQSTDNGQTWSNATGTSNGVTYSPGSLTQTTLYKRNVISNSCLTTDGELVTWASTSGAPVATGLPNAANEASVWTYNNSIKKAITGWGGQNGWGLGNPGMGWGVASETISNNGGYVQGVMEDNNNYQMLALSGTTFTNYTDLKFALYPAADGNLYIYENGSPVAGPGTSGSWAPYSVGDVLKVSVINNQVNYYQNGTLLHTSANTPTFPLYADVSIYSPNGGFDNVRVLNPVQITVNTPSTAPTGISGLTSVCSGAGDLLTATGGTAGTGSTYQWGTGTVGSNIIAGQTASTYTPSPTAPTTYWVNRIDPAPCSTNTGGQTISVSITTTTPSPNPATALVFSGQTTSQISGSFTASNSAPTGYIVVQSTSSSLSPGPVTGTTYTVGNSLGGGTVIAVGASTSFTASSLATGTQYYYYVYAYNTSTCAGSPAYSTVLAGNTYTCPNAPTGSATPSSTSAVITWSTTVGYTYNLQWELSGGSFATISGVTSPYTLTGLSGSSTYIIQLSASLNSEAACNNVYGSQTTFTTECPVTSVGFWYSTTAANLATNNLPPTGSGTGAFQVTGVVSAGNISYSLTGLPACTQYYYKTFTLNGSSGYTYATGTQTFTTTGGGTPTVTVVSPASACQGTTPTINITGTNFTPSTTVMINGVSATTNFTYNSTTSISVTLPALGVGTGNVVVTNCNGPSPTAPANAFAVTAPPTLSGLTSGSPSGCTVSVSATPSSGAVAYWQNTTTGGTSTTTGTSPYTSPQNVTANGTYYYNAYNATTGCWSGTSSVVVSSLTAPSTETANNLVYCSNSSGASIGLAASQSGVNYVLKNGSGTALGTTSGTGAAITALTGGPAPTSGNNYSIVATSTANGCSTTITPVTVSTNPAPTLGGATQSAAVCPSSTATINLTGLVSGSTFNLTYTINGGGTQTVNGIVASGTSASFSTIALTAGNNGQTLQITGITIPGTGCSQSFTQNVTLAVNSAPVISVQPVSQTICSSASSISFPVTASGTGNTYQWYYRQNVLGWGSWTAFAAGDGYGENSTYSTSTLTISNPYSHWNVPIIGYPPTQFEVIITDACGNVTSSAAQMYFVTATPTYYTGITGPGVVTPGCNATYTIGNSQNETSYTWTVTGTGWSINSGQNTASLVATAGTGTGTITVSSANVCGTSTNTPSQTVLDLTASVSPAVSACGSTATLSGSTNPVVPITTTLFSDNFESDATGAIPTTGSLSNWQAYYFAGGTGTTNKMYISNSCAINGNNSMAMGNSTTPCTYNGNKTTELLASNIIAIDGRMYKNINISFNWICQGYADGLFGDEAGYAMWSPDNIHWNAFGSELINKSTSQAVTNLNIGADGQMFYIGFYWQNNNEDGTNTPALIVDNVVVSGTVVPSYSWTASGGGNIVSGATTLTPTVVASGNYALNVTANGCSSSASTVLTLAAQPVSGTITPSPAAGGVCTGGTVSATATAGSGGDGTVADVLQYQYDGTGPWNTYTAGSPLTTSTHSSVSIQTYRTATGSNCNQSTPNVVTWTISAQPTPGTLTPTPAVGTICSGGNVSATATGGTGGTGNINDVLQYSLDGGTWITYQSGGILSTSGHSTISIQTYRTAAGSSCNQSSATVVTWNIVAQPVSGTLTPTPAAGAVCTGSTVSATATAGNGGSGASDVLQYSLDGGAWVGYASGTGIPTTGHSSISIQTYRVATGSNCNQSTANIVTWSITPTVGTPTAITIASGSQPGCQLVNATTSTTYATTATNTTGFNWSINNPAAGSINAASGVMSWTNGFAGTVTISVNASGCNGPSSTVTRTVVVTPNVTPSVSIDPTPNYIVCSTDQIHFTATASGTGGSTPTYQWEINGNPVGGQTNPTYTDNAPADGAIVTCVLTSTYACPTPGSNPATSNSTTVVVGICNNTWNGSVAGDNTNWDNPGNWNANHVPSNCADGANFPPGLAHYPILTQPESVGDVILQQPGGTVNLGSYNLSVCGNITVETATQAPASVSIPSTGGLIVLDGIAGSSTQTISGALTAYEVKVNTQATGGAMLTNTGSITVNNALDLQLGNLNATTAGSSITFTSSSVTQVAILDNFSPGFTGTITTNNNVKSQRYYAVSTYFYTHQHMMGSPVSGASTTLAQMGAGSTSGYVIPQADCDEYAMGAGTPYGNVFKLDQSHGATCGMAQWYVEPGGTAVTNGQGYSVVLPGSGTLTLTGSANTSPDYTLTSLANNNWINATAEHHTLSSGWQLVSNPYQATLALNTANSGMDGQVQVWQANGPFEGTYVAGLVGSVNIAPFQAYMVHVSTPGNMNGSYTINGADRVRTPATFLNQNANELDITAQNMGNNLLDKAVVAFNTSATDSFDTQFDADKFAGSEGRHLVYTALNDGKWMAINTLHDVATTSTVPMGFEPGSSGNYSFAFDKVNTFDPTTYIFLEDKQQQVMYNVRNGNYLFSSDAADGWNRFVLHFTPPAVIASTDAGCNSLGVINITQPGTANWDYTLTDAGNTVIASGVLNQNNPLNLSAPAGTYTLTLVDNNNYTVTKVIQLNGAQPVTAAFAPSANNVNTQAAVNFTNTSTGANTYSWNFGDGSTSALVSPVHTYTAPGIYTVELTATNASGCSAISNQTITVSNTATGINAVTENGISLWSNTNKVYVDFTHAGTDVNAVIKIYDVLGQELSEDKYTLNGLYQKEIDNIEAAYIIVAVNNNDKITTKKLFINNIAK